MNTAKNGERYIQYSSETLKNHDEVNGDDEEDSDETLEDEEDDQFFHDALDHYPPKLPSI